MGTTRKPLSHSAYALEGANYFLELVSTTSASSPFTAS